MAKIRFEDVTITAKAIQLEGIEDPSELLKAVGVENPSVGEVTDETTKELPQKEEPVQAKEEAAPPKKKKKRGTKKKVAPKVDASMFSGARRLRDIVEVFIEVGINDATSIVEHCVEMQDSVPILSRVSDIPERMTLAVAQWEKEAANAVS